ncbi:MAG TPA: TAXI family TRAP transporter solute-binding subunit [Gammaproteobacteria bacterium]|nr:TAXI family TRAP transporter solute-binding subunit [Gammaproteobacteria bacterium]
MFKPTGKTVLALSLGLSFALSATGASAGLKRVTIGTNPQGTLYYVVGGGFSKLLYDKLGIRATAQPYSGSSVYLPLIQSGEVTMGLSSSLDSGMAFSGKGPYSKTSALKGLRALAMVWPLPYAYFAKASSGMKTIADLKGKRVVVDFKANASLKAANIVMLKAGGINPEKDVHAVTVTGLPDGYRGVTEGTIDASATALAIPLARKAQATIPGGLVMLNITGPNATSEFTNRLLPGLYITKSKPGKNNVGVNSEISVTGFDIFLLIGRDVSDQDAYAITKLLYQNWSDLKKKYKVLGRNTAKGLAKASNTVPYHPGAIKYFKEIGLWTNENVRREKALME